MRRLHERVAGFLFPTRAVCLGCGDPAGMEEEWLCPRCRARLKPGVHRLQSDEWPRDGISREWFAMFYEDPVARLVRQFKYGGVYRLAPFLAECLRPLLSALNPADYDCLVAVPLHEKRRLERGFNQSDILAGLISERTGIRLENAVRRTKNTNQQARLSTDARKKNVLGAFECTASLEGKRVLLIDDVFTTGSTVNSCAQALRAGGARDVQALTVAASHHYRHREIMIYRKKPPGHASKP